MSFKARRPIIVLVLLSLVVAALPVAATTISECALLITNLRTELDGVEIGGRNAERTRASLESKLDGALIKIDQAKFCDAIVKLEQFRDAVLTMSIPNAKGETKIDPVGADSLAAGANEAIGCLLDLAPECL